MVATVNIYDMAQDWSAAAGAALTAIKMDVANVASAGANSYLLDLLTDSTSKFRVSKTVAGGLEIGTFLSRTAIYDITHGTSDGGWIGFTNGLFMGRGNDYTLNVDIGLLALLNGSELRFYSDTGGTPLGRVSFPSTGVLTLKDGAGTSFGRIQFGGTTSSFPALKRSSAVLQVRLADDSADAQLDVGALRVNQTPTANGSASTLITSGADSSTNLGHRASFNMNGTTYWFPCGSVAF